ncbi:diguanylate cyclase [Bacillus sp. B-jedd]|uniref:diguanylate cyclase n=1 Tax=Bacillus sp. B-jedd TaxID=1476857 RepID=UPI0005156E77|nr:diguanylate cyclase [Bacillus sp. B-jedd]CEG29753.1 response regulator diguanylate cyclase/phosphodiesterase [Bacillus sp. B-jedd]
MEIKKFEKMLLKRIKNQLSDWFDIQDAVLPTEGELYQFLHSIKGTAGTVGLMPLSNLSGRLMDGVEEGGSRQWSAKALRDYLLELSSMTYNYEAIIDEEKECTDRNVPLIQIISEDVGLLVHIRDAMEENGWIAIAYTSYEKAARSQLDIKPDCIVIDNDGDAILALRHFGKLNRNQFLPTVLLGVGQNRKARMDAYREGADDVIEKPLEMDELKIRVGRLLERKKLFDQSALLDELTGLYNRRFLEDAFRRNQAALSRTNKPFCIAILDLDNFKTINDEYGHLAGDRILAAFSLTLKEGIRASDISFRLGGEEFGILFPDTDMKQARNILERLLKECKEKSFTENGKIFSVTFSAGTFLVNDEGINLETVLESADQAMYSAKRNGKSRIAEAEHGNPLSKKTLHISIIDDDAIIRSMLSKIIGGLDTPYYEMDVDVFEDGRKFFDSGRLDEEGSHFLILDGVMPVMDGLEVLQKVRRDFAGRAVKVLMLTGRKNEYDIARALQLGADDYVTKPFSITELEARVKVLIQRPN